MQQGVSSAWEKNTDIERYSSFLHRLNKDACIAQGTLNRHENDLRAVQNLLKDLLDIDQVHRLFKDPEYLHHVSLICIKSAAEVVLLQAVHT